LHEFKLHVFFSGERQAQSRDDNFVASAGVRRLNVKVSYFTFAVNVK
jgi:hypothetical protein